MCYSTQKKKHVFYFFFTFQAPGHPFDTEAIASVAFDDFAAVPVRNNTITNRSKTTKENMIL